MLGLMQDWPLLVNKMLDHGAANHAEREFVTRSVEGPIRRYTLADLRLRALQAAKALEKEGLAWVIGSRPWPGTPTGTLKPGSASWVWAPFAIR